MSRGAIKKADPYITRRNNEIWSRRLEGVPPRRLAEIYELSESTIHHIIDERRKMLPQEAVEELRERSLAFLNELGTGVMEIYRKEAPPVTSGKDGDIVYDPETGEVVRDYTTKLKAVEVALKVWERLHRVAGVDAPKVIEVDSTVTDATREAAAMVLRGGFGLLIGGADAQDKATG